MQLKDRIARLFGLATPVGDEAATGVPAEAATTVAGATAPEDPAAESEPGGGDGIASPQVDTADKASATENGA